jgi:hypothetical protein
VDGELGIDVAVPNSDSIAGRAQDLLGCRPRYSSSTTASMAGTRSTRRIGNRVPVMPGRVVPPMTASQPPPAMQGARKSARTPGPVTWPTTRPRAARRSTGCPRAGTDGSTTPSIWPGHPDPLPAQPRPRLLRQETGRRQAGKEARSGGPSGYSILALRGLHLTGAAQVSALLPESAWQGPDPGLTCGFCSVDRRSTPVKWRPCWPLWSRGSAHKGMATGDSGLNPVALPPTVAPMWVSTPEAQLSYVESESIFRVSRLLEPFSSDRLRDSAVS